MLKADLPLEDKQRLDAYLGNVAKKTEELLEELLPQPGEGAEESQLFEAMRYSIFAGGKRVRPTLVMAANDILGGREERGLRVAAAIEVLHTYSLVHDDLPCMDDDDLRRGQPTCHKKYDEATAVLTGDALLTYAFEILTDEATHRDPKVRLDLVHTLATAAGPMGMVGGQMIDILNTHSGATDMEQGALARLQRKKTGALFSACCEMAVQLNGATREQRGRLTSYAQNIGLAYQMVDDVLDETGDRETLGKTVGKDKAQAKPTFATLLGVDGAARQAQFLCAQAEEYLSIFDDRADVLRLLARFVVARKH